MTVRGLAVTFACVAGATGGAAVAGDPVRNGRVIAMAGHHDTSPPCFQTTTLFSRLSNKAITFSDHVAKPPRFRSAP